MTARAWEVKGLGIWVSHDADTDQYSRGETRVDALAALESAVAMRAKHPTRRYCVVTFVGDDVEDIHQMDTEATAIGYARGYNHAGKDKDTMLHAFAWPTDRRELAECPKAWLSLSGRQQASLLNSLTQTQREEFIVATSSAPGTHSSPDGSLAASSHPRPATRTSSQTLRSGQRIRGPSDLAWSRGFKGSGTRHKRRDDQ